MSTTINTSASAGFYYALSSLLEILSCLSYDLGSMAGVLCSRCLLRFRALCSLDRCSPKTRVSHNVTKIKVTLIANILVDVKVRLDSCWPSDEKGHSHWCWFGSADICVGSKVDQPLPRLFWLGEME